MNTRYLHAPDLREQQLRARADRAEAALGRVLTAIDTHRVESEALGELPAAVVGRLRQVVAQALADRPPRRTVG